MDSSKQSNPKRCGICEGDAIFQFTKVILNKYTPTYFQCDDCEFLFTDSSEWNDAAYSEPISSLDVGLVERNLRVSLELKWILKLLHLENEPSLDFAGGTGLLTRMMRDRGFNFYWNDKYTLNIHARGFE